jgi:hypothetical protein
MSFRAGFNIPMGWEVVCDAGGGSSAALPASRSQGSGRDQALGASPLSESTPLITILTGP